MKTWNSIMKQHYFFLYLTNAFLTKTLPVPLYRPWPVSQWNTSISLQLHNNKFLKATTVYHYTTIQHYCLLHCRFFFPLAHPHKATTCRMVAGHSLYTSPLTYCREAMGQGGVHAFQELHNVSHSLNAWKRALASYDTVLGSVWYTLEPE